MDTRIEQTNSIGKGHLPSLGLRDQAVAKSPRIEPAAKGERSAPGRPTRQSHTPPALRDAAVRVETALAALRQIEDLVGTVSDNLQRHAATSSDPRADERLVRSALATAQDIVEHARVDGQPLLGTGRLQRYPGADARASAAVRSYAKSEGGYQQAKAEALPPLVRQSLATARAFVGGSQGILETLASIAEHGPYSGQDVLQAFRDIGSTVSGLTALLTEAKTREVLPAISGGLPEDLRF